MKVFLVKFAGLLAMMSFIFCTEVSESPAAPEASGSTESPKEPLFCNVPLDDQEKIFDCIKREISEPNSEFAKKTEQLYNAILRKYQKILRPLLVIKLMRFVLI
uniref:Putative salivary secreted peptide n=1 Tax=Ixodes ricinus TaxID=34613 RepID=V5H5M1_IXORI